MPRANPYEPYDTELQQMFARETKRAMRRQRLTQRQLARRAGISDGYVTQLFSGKTVGSLGSWASVFKALNLTVTVTHPDGDQANA